MARIFSTIHYFSLKLYSVNSVLAKKKIRWILVATTCAAVLLIGAVYARAHFALLEARKLIAAEIWPQGRTELSKYLRVHPNDAEARLMMAEAFARDEELTADKSAPKALVHLARIPADTNVSGQARLYEAKLLFLSLEKPGQAEKHVRQALDQGADELLAYDLLWTILKMTGRHELSENVFWRIYDLSDPNDRVLRLRDWYMSQIFPTSANEILDRGMEILGPNEPTSATAVSRRYMRFRESEPRSPINHAALAQWLQAEGDPDTGKILVDGAAEQLEGTQDEPFFLAAQISIYLDLGETERAKAALKSWPQDDQSQPYWLWSGIIADDVDGDTEKALKAYDKALTMWPSHLDWRLRHRRAECLSRLKRTNEAEAERERAKRVQELLKPELHGVIRNALGELNDPARLEVIAEFYSRLGRKREAAYWREYIGRLPPKP